jgi:hypothetical protein
MKAEIIKILRKQFSSDFSSLQGNPSLRLFTLSLNHQQIFAQLRDKIQIEIPCTFMSHNCYNPHDQYHMLAFSSHEDDAIEKLS